jgi:hypothetical protein
MAKQTFTTGQVLTAAQMTSLQQTAMSGGAASAKTASYTLVAADAGTAISMSNASATTITVNTALFAAGDTVQITNLGAGVCTITAGTATVNTSASLALAQYESGTLDFTSTSAAIFIKGAGGSAGGMTLLSTTTLSGASTVISSISQDYKNLQLVVRNYKPATDNMYANIRLNADTGTRYGHQTASASAQTFSDTSMRPQFTENDDTVATGLDVIDFYDYANTVTMKMTRYRSFHNNATTTSNYNFATGFGFYNQLDAISSITIFANSGNLTSGTALLYGVK